MRWTVTLVAEVQPGQRIAALDDVTRRPDSPGMRPRIWASRLGRTRPVFGRSARTSHARGRQTCDGRRGKPPGLSITTSPTTRWCSGPNRSRRAGGPQVANVALARKLAHVLHAMWKHETTYNPTRGARPIAA